MALTIQVCISHGSYESKSKKLFIDTSLMHKPTVTEKEFHDEFDKLLEVLGVSSPFLLVVQV